MKVHLPHDVILNHILPSIPAKSVYRFKCVSKEWHTFLTSEMFQNKYNRLHVDDQKLLILSKTRTSFEFTTINCGAPPSDHKGLSPRRRPLPPFEGITPSRIIILTSCHGLVCPGISIDVSSINVYSNIYYKILWNPLTNEYKRLSRSNSHREFNYVCSDFGLYYNCCEDDYKLVDVNFVDTNFYIYSLRSDSWRKVDGFPRIRLLNSGRWSRGTYLNGNLYFLQEELNGWLSSIIRFDTKTERLSKIETPNGDVILNFYSAIIMVKSDCIHVCVKYDTGTSYDSGFGRATTCIKLLKLDEYGNMEQVVTYQLRTSVYDIPFSSLVPFHLTKNGEWLMRARDNHQIYKVDLKKRMHIKDKGKHKRKRKEKGNIYDDLDYEKVRVGDPKIVDEEVRYIETFVSPNRYMK